MTLADYRRYFDLNFDQFLVQHHLTERQVAHHLRYEKITDVSRVTVGDNQFFFFRDGKLKVIYISEEALAKRLWSEFKETTTSVTPEKTVRSRAGKTSNQLIFPQQGFTASVNKGDVDFIEIYPPCAVQQYLQDIYDEPMRFIR